MVDGVVKYKVSVGVLLLGQPRPFAKERAGYIYNVVTVGAPKSEVQAAYC
jgi:hypothetical protein